MVTIEQLDFDHLYIPRTTQGEPWPLALGLGFLISPTNPGPARPGILWPCRARAGPDGSLGLKTTRGKLDPNCPTKDCNMIEEILVGTYVDDCVYAGSSDFISNWFNSYIASKFEVKQSETRPLD